MEKKLYKWQEECLNRWQQSGCRGMVQAVTGSGKTLLALTAADWEYKVSNSISIKNQYLKFRYHHSDIFC